LDAVLGDLPLGNHLYFLSWVSEFKRGCTYTSDEPRSERSKTAITLEIMDNE